MPHGLLYFRSKVLPIAIGTSPSERGEYYSCHSACAEFVSVNEESKTIITFTNQKILKTMLTEGIYSYHVYIITNKTKTVIYTGMTNYLARRLFEHAQNIIDNKITFASKYKCQHLLYYEKFTWVQEAIAREKEIKGWSRNKKLELIKTINPDFNFLEHLFPFKTTD